MKKILFLLIFITKYAFLFAQNADSVIVLDNETEILNIGKQVYLLEDKEGKLTIEDIQKPEYQRAFKKSEQKIPNFNTTASTIWVKLTVFNQTEKEIYLEVAQALAWHVDFYKPDSVGKPILTTQTGIMRPMESREVDNNFFLFELSKNPKPQTYYFSIQSESSIIIPLYLATKQAQMGKSNFYNWFFGGFSGLVLIMFFYNLFVAYSVRDKVYLYYCAYLLNILFIVNYLSGNFGYQLNPVSYYPQYLITFLGLGAWCIFLFLNSLLALSTTSYLYRVLLFGLVFNCIFGGINLFTKHFVSIFDLIQIVTLFIFIFIVVYSLIHYLKGNKKYRFVVYGFSFYLLGSVIFILQNFGLFPTNFFTSNVNIFGVSIEILFFSLALSDRINTMRNEKEQAEANVLQKTKENELILAKQNEILAQRVAEKTKDLQQAYGEIQVSNEELQQTQEELMSQRDLLQENNYTLELFRTKITYSIRSAYTIQQAILPPKAKLDEILCEYFIINRPKDQVSGDFYWVNQIDNKKFLIVADCTGHGVSGAFMTMIGNTLLDKIIKVWNIYDPAQILETVHTEIQAVLQQAETGNTDGMDVAVTVLEESENLQGFRVEFAGAKRPMYYIEKGQIEIEKLLGVRKSVGAFTNENKHYQTESMILAKGSMIYMASDGYADQNDQNRQSFSERRFMEMLSITQEKTLVEQKKFLEEALDQHMAGAEQRDDILVVGVRV